MIKTFLSLYGKYKVKANVVNIHKIFKRHEGGGGREREGWKNLRLNANLNN